MDSQHGETRPPTVSGGGLIAEPREGGACWAFIAAQFRFIIFGVYPPEEQWRPLLVIGLIIAMILRSLSPKLWGTRLICAWVVAATVMLVLMWGGVFGLTPVPISNWCGLPVTLLLALLSLGLGFPFGVFLALGRRSTLPIPRLLSLLTIELVRGLPQASNSASRSRGRSA